MLCIFRKMYIYEPGWRTPGPENNLGCLGFEQTISFPCGNRATIARFPRERRAYQKHHNVRYVFEWKNAYSFLGNFCVSWCNFGKNQKTNGGINWWHVVHLQANVYLRTWLKNAIVRLPSDFRNFVKTNRSRGIKNCEILCTFRKRNIHELYLCYFSFHKVTR